jgi:hypothetical protein
MRGIDPHRLKAVLDSYRRATPVYEQAMELVAGRVPEFAALGSSSDQGAG